MHMTMAQQTSRLAAERAGWQQAGDAFHLWFVTRDVGADPWGEQARGGLTWESARQLPRRYRFWSSNSSAGA